MLFSRKGNPLQCPELSLCGQVLEQVECFKLGVLLTSYLTWSKHNESNCATAKKHLGRTYRCFSEMLIQIPTLYCTCMKAWFDHILSMLPKYGTHTSKRISICLRESQKIVLRMCSKDYNINYEDLLQSFQLPELSTKRLYLRLSLMVKIVHESFFPSKYFCSHELNIMSCKTLHVPSTFCSY